MGNAKRQLGHEPPYMELKHDIFDGKSLYMGSQNIDQNSTYNEEDLDNLSTDELTLIQNSTLKRLDELKTLETYCERALLHAVNTLTNSEEIQQATTTYHNRIQRIHAMERITYLKPVTELEEDIQKLIQKERKNTDREFNYELQTAWRQQALRKAGSASLDTNGGVFVSYNEVMDPTLMSPLGPRGVDRTIDTAEFLSGRLQSPIYIKKVTERQKNELLLNRGFDVFDYPYDEDKYPQVISNLHNLSTLAGKGWRQIAQKINVFHKKTEQQGKKITYEDFNFGNVMVNKEAIIKMIESWATTKLSRLNTSLTNTDNEYNWAKWDLIEPYTAFLDKDFLNKLNENELLGLLMFISDSNDPTNKELIGMSLVGKTNTNTGALYINLNQPLHNGSAQKLIIETARELKQKHQVNYLNLGGSETENLYTNFKRKFNPLSPEEEPKLHYLVYSRGLKNKS